MAIDKAAMETLVGFDPRMSAAYAAISPYLTVLKRLGKQGVDAFLDGARQQDWARVDRALYEGMTEAERDALGAQLLKDARNAVRLSYESNRLWQEDLLRLVLGLLLSAI